MIRNYLLTALRNIKREKIYSLLNIVGLAMGIGCALVIYKIVTYELSYDRHQENFDNIYRIVREKQISTGINYNEGVPHPLGPALKSDFSQMVSALTHYMYGGLITINGPGGNRIKYQEESGVVFAEPTIFDVFTTDFLAGNQSTALENPGSGVIASSLAQKYFGLTPNNLDQALGQVITLENALDIHITGVISDPPRTTDAPFLLLIHYNSQESVNPYYGKGTRWNSNSSQTNCFVRLEGSQRPEDIANQFPAFIDKYYGDGTSEKERYVLQPLSDLHYNTNYGVYSESQITKESLFALAVVGIFLIVTGAINFINLATAQAVKRSKEVGVRKALGGNRIQLATQFLSETILITLMASFVGFVISELLFIYLKDILGYKLTLDLLSNLETLFFVVLLVSFVGFMSGLYPAIIMARMDPVVALKNKLHNKTGSGFLSLRRVLVVVQFTISQTLIIGTIVVSTQLDYFLAKDLGFEKDAIYLTDLPDNDITKTKRFRTELLQNPDIQQVSLCLSSPTGNSNSHANIHHKSLQEDEEYRVNFKIADPHYFDLFGIELLAGRIYSDKDSSNQILINRQLSELIGFSNPNDAIGERIRGWRGESEIIGVVEDFHTRSLRRGLDYVAIINNPGIFYEVAIKINTQEKNLSQIQSTIKEIEMKWGEVFPEYIINGQFYDEQLADRYDDEEAVSKLFQLFAVIAILIGCLGLYGLIAYMANQKTKEIGVRKVLGASTWNILNIFSKEMFGLIVIAFILAAPMGYYVMNLWLEDFAYRIPMSPLYFLMAIAVCAVIALLTVGYKSVSASMSNPVLSLKDE